MPNYAAATAYAKELGLPPPAGSPHSVPIPGTERPGRSPIYRHWRFTDKPLLTCLDPEVLTVDALFESSAEAFPNRPCLGTRAWIPATRSWDTKYRWMTYGEINKRRKNFGAGLVEVHKGIGYPKDKYGVGLWSQNRSEWQIVDLGCISQGLFTVSLYETLGPDAVEFIAKHAELSCIVSSLSHIPTLLKLAPRLPLLKIIVSMDSLDDGEPTQYTKASLLSQLAAQHGIQIWSIDQLEKIGEKSGRIPRPSLPEDIYTINYTSGTTGTPKGVILTHRSVIAANSATRVSSTLNQDDVGISYLPLAHLLQRIVEHAAFAAGSAAAYFRGDLQLLPEDIKMIQPTGFVSVPRLFNRFNAAIRDATIESDGFKGSLSRHIIDKKLDNMKQPMGQASSKHWFYDRLLTNKIRNGIGFDRVHTMASGSAPLDPAVQEFLSAALSVRLHQGYGLTESSGLATVQLEGDYSTGNVGPPAACVEICLESIPELEYSVTDKPFPRGEVLMRGPSIFAGYFKNEEENKKVLEKDGWFHTGDIALIDELGRVKVIDRKKNIVKLSQGEYVAPERIENVYTGKCPLIAMAFVHGNSQKSNLVGIFGVNPETFAPFASKVLGHHIEPIHIEALAEAATHPKVKGEFHKILEKIGKDSKFNGYERVKNILLAVEPFTVENEMLTPTLKLKRPQAAKAFASEIDRLYAEIEAQSSPSKHKL